MLLTRMHFSVTISTIRDNISAYIKFLSILFMENIIYSIFFSLLFCCLFEETNVKITNEYKRKKEHSYRLRKIQICFFFHSISVSLNIFLLYIVKSIDAIEFTLQILAKEKKKKRIEKGVKKTI